MKATLPKNASGQIRSIQPEDFTKKAAMFLPPTARYDVLAALPEGADLGKALVQAMEAIEAANRSLAGALPKQYDQFEPDLLRNLLRIFNSDQLQRAGGDVFGRIYEYFLNKFAMSLATEEGAFFTPPSLVRLIVNVIEPQQGIVLDCALGSAGMFVQTGYFLERHHTPIQGHVTFVGQEKSEEFARLARMNLAVHGLEGDVHVGNTFYDTLPELIGQCNFVMANPPFNVDMVDPLKVKDDRRLPFGLPGISAKTGAVSNANYLWIQYFYSYLSDQGRAGFVMASSATDAGHGEKTIRQKLVESGAVDAIIAIGTNFFYTRSLPCTLWFLDRAKPSERADTVLMLDARAIYHTISRKVRDFTEEQLQNLTAVVWLYRGETERYLTLVGGYLEAAYGHAAALAVSARTLDAPVVDLDQRLAAWADVLEAEAANPPARTGRNGGNGAERSAEAVALLRALLAEQATALDAWQATRDALVHELVGLTFDPVTDLRTNDGQRAVHDALAVQADALRSLQNAAVNLTKRSAAALEHTQKRLHATSHPQWQNRLANDLLAKVEAAEAAIAADVRQCLYQLAQATWLQSRFPEAQFVSVPGLCKAVSREEIAANDSSLTPGRYVGIGQMEADDEKEFTARLTAIHLELEELDAEAMELSAIIGKNFSELV